MCASMFTKGFSPYLRLHKYSWRYKGKSDSWPSCFFALDNVDPTGWVYGIILMEEFLLL